MARRRPAIIFDFGNVVAFFDYRKASTEWGRSLGITGEALLDRVRDVGFSALVREYESGQISSEAFSCQVRELAGLKISHEEFASAWADIFEINEPVARLIAALKREGYTLVLGSNTNELHATQFRQQFSDTLAHFDRLILSYEVSHIKPSRAFYESCAEAAGEPPEACVFIDDLPENIDGARAAGLAGVVFRDLPGLVRDLRLLGVEVPEIH